MTSIGKFARATIFAAAVTALAVPAARADEISVTHWGALMYGVPYAVAMDKGFFKKAGVDITGILTSKGGGTTVRNVLAGGLPYGEVSLAAAIAAINQGMDIKIVNGGVQNVADAFWVTLPASDVKTIKDLAGKKMAITSPKAVTDMLSIMLLEKNGMTIKDVERPALGSVSAGLSALENGAVQAAYISEPILSARPNKYRVVVAAKDVLPKMMQTVGITTGEFIKKEPAKLKAIVAGRRMGVDFIYANPSESATILAKAYNIDPKVAKSAVDYTAQAKYWGPGNFDIPGMNEMVRGLKIVGEVKGDIDWEKIVDRSFLPDDLKR
ncbi:MAG: ABC transporter substrate-binding protein [Alphaproteobacteria bacterium]